MSGCYEGEGDTGEGRCRNRADYRAKLSSAAHVQHLCAEHAALVRANWPDDVEWIMSLVRVEKSSPGR